MLIELNVVKQSKMKVKKFEDTSIAIKLVTAGSAACLADLVTFPLDTAKVRLQIQGEGIETLGAKTVQQYRGVFKTIATICKEEGPKNLYRGLSAGLQRQMCFASVRIGMYDSVKGLYQAQITGGKNVNKILDILVKISAGVTTGALSVVFAQPTDVVKVRFQALQGKEQRYRSTTEAYKMIYKYEGVRGLWKGMYPNIARNAIVNVSEIVCYDIVKSAILGRRLLEDNTLCHFTSAGITGFVTTVVASPVDVIKTRYMNSPPGLYKNAMNCAVKTVKIEGFTALYKGFLPSFYRLISWNIVMWISYEKLKIFAVEMLNER